MKKETTKQQNAAEADKQAPAAPKRTNKTWEAFGRSKGCFIVNDPAFRL